MWFGPSTSCTFITNIKTRKNNARNMQLQKKKIEKI